MFEPNFPLDPQVFYYSFTTTDNHLTVLSPFAVDQASSRGPGNGAYRLDVCCFILAMQDAHDSSISPSPRALDKQSFIRATEAAQQIPSRKTYEWETFVRKPEDLLDLDCRCFYPSIVVHAASVV
ncbi:hypothetical protein EIP91_000388 [Steccherinum ochraceum]|uniref:Uncharacterized protein n=1 Tax=Steccherinum ochraceum TaxID=92696 RepID=A0A4R0RJB7_9APHY|nr:hypothetical protein EIP91_000388 [Steccherinum ochraceum]